MQESTTNDVKRLRTVLDSTDIVQNSKDLKECLSKALALEHEDVDTKLLLPSVLKHLSSTDPVCKKLALWFITKHGSHADLLLAVNSLVKDCQDASPMTRGVALRALTQLSQCDFVEYSTQATVRGLHDNSSYVRRVAVLGCAKLHKLQPQCVHERGLIDALYGMIRDPDPVVVVNCLHSLDEILRNDGGVVINRNINNYLLNRLEEIPANLVANLVQFLSKYTPKTEEEIFDIMNICDDYMNYGSASSVVQIVKYFLHLTRDLPEVRRQVLQRVKTPVLQLLGSGNPELTYTVLDFVESVYFPGGVEEMIPSYQSFMCKQKEPVFVKLKRMQLLSQLVSDSNIKEIMEDLFDTAKSADQNVSQRAIKSFGEIIDKNGQFLSICVDKLSQLLSLDRPQINGHVFSVLSCFHLKSLDKCIIYQIISSVCKSLLKDDSYCTQTELLWLIGEYGEYNTQSAYVIEEYVSNFDSWHNTDLCTSLITTAVKLLLKLPAQCQLIVGELLEVANERGDFIVQQCVLYYYDLLRRDVDIAKRILLGGS